MNSKLAWAGALSTFILAGTAHAQVAPPVWYPQQYLAHVSIQARPFVELEVVPSRPTPSYPSAPLVARCTEYCDFWTFPGTYTLYARDQSTGESKQLSLHIERSSRFDLQLGDDADRATGLGLGIGGSAAIFAGLIMMVPVLLSVMCEGPSCTTDAEQQVAVVGLGLVLGGAIATPIGWSMYIHNRTRLKRIHERSYQALESPNQVRVGVVGFARGGFGLGAIATF